MICDSIKTFKAIIITITPKVHNDVCLCEHTQMFTTYLQKYLAVLLNGGGGGIQVLRNTFLF